MGVPGFGMPAGFHVGECQVVQGLAMIIRFVIRRLQNTGYIQVMNRAVEPAGMRINDPEGEMGSLFIRTDP